MATISSVIKLTDGMSPALRTINKALGTTLTSFEALQRATGQAIDTKKLQAANVAVDKIANNTAEAAVMSEKLDKGFDRVVAAIGLAVSQLGEMSTTMRGVWSDTAKIARGTDEITKNQKTLNASVAKGFTTLDKNQRAIHQANVNQIRLTASFKKGVMSATQMLQPISRVDDEINKGTAAQQRFNNAAKGGAGAMGNLVNQVKMLVGAYMGIQTVGGIIKTADQLTQTTARLNLMNDGLQTTAQLEDKIYQAAMRSSAGFMDTADAVAKLGLRAGNIFKSNDETIAFTETLNKMFVIAGASQAEMSSATLQLTQALGAGVLRGEEFNAVFEAAPNVMQAVADYINQPIGALKKLASDGKISAEVVKNALFAATDDVNKQFKTIPLTWGNVWTLVKNYTIKATRPILSAISKITSSERFIRFANGVGNAITRIAGFMRNVGSVLSPILGWIFDKVAGIYNFISRNWSIIAPIVWGVAAAFLVMKTPLMLVAIWTGICTAATKLWTAAQAVFNAVMAANPITLVILAVIALVAVFYIAIAAVNKMTGSTLSATGIIAGAFTWLWALLQNIFIGICNAFIGVYNIAIGCAQWVVEAWNWAGENMGAIFENIGIWWDNLWIDAQIGFNNFIADVLSKLSSLAQKIQPLADLLDIDLSGLAGAAGKYSAKSASLSASKKSYKKLTSFNPNVNWDTARYMQFKDLGAAYDKGYNWGSNLSDKVSAFFSGEDYKNLTKGLTNGLDLNGATAGNGLNDLGKALSGALGDGSTPALDKIANGVGDIAGNTGDISNQLDRTESDLNFMRDLATQKAINRHYYTDMHVTQNNNNSINSALDIDAVTERFRQQLVQKLNARVAAGIHY